MSCLPVIVLGFGAGLTHLLRLDESKSGDAPGTHPETVPEQPKPRVATDAEDAARVALAGEQVQDAEESAYASAKHFQGQNIYLLGEIIFMIKDYPELRSFYSKMETKDQESVVLTTAPVTASKTVPTGN